MSNTKTSSDFINEIEALFARWFPNKYDEKVSQIRRTVRRAQFDSLVRRICLYPIENKWLQSR